MAKPYFVLARASKTWHIIYPGDIRPLCGTRAALYDTSFGSNVPSSSPDNYICANCRGVKRLRDDKVYITTYQPKVVCSECGAKVDIERWPHRHQKIWQVEDDE